MKNFSTNFSLAIAREYAKTFMRFLFYAALCISPSLNDTSTVAAEAIIRIQAIVDVSAKTGLESVSC